MIKVGLLRVASQLCMLVMVGAILLAFIQQEQNIFFWVVAAVFFGLAIFTGLKAKEQNIKTRVQIEEKERSRIRAKRDE
jgi:uncharacterized membrane protein YbhN (UPF0104 family)